MQQPPRPQLTQRTLNGAGAQNYVTAGVRNRKPDLSSLVYGKIPPQAPELEEAVLGAIMLERDKLAEVLDIIQTDTCFYVDAHQKIYSAVLRLSGKGSPVDLLTVTEELRKTNELELIGGAYYLTRLTMNVVSSAHVEAHARIVMEKHIQREMIRISGNVIADAYEDSTDVFELLDDASAGLSALSLGNASGYSNAQDLARIALDDLDHILKHDGQVTGVPTGFRRLDELTNGWQKGDLIIIAARPSIGKTAFALALMMNAVTNAYKPGGCGFFSLEMSKGQLMKRILCSMAHVELTNINSGQLDKTEIDRYNLAAARFSKLPVFIDDQPAINVFQLRAKARRMKQKHDIQMIIVDYLQLMSGLEQQRTGNREQEVSKISRDLKALAKELEIPIIALSQLNRSVETRGDKTPQLSDLRESGSLEQDTDMVMFLSRPDYGKTVDETDPAIANNADIHIRKNRMGAIDDIPMYFVKPVQTWFDRAGYEQYCDEHRWDIPAQRPQTDNPRVGITPPTFHGPVVDPSEPRKTDFTEAEDAPF